LSVWHGDQHKRKDSGGRKIGYRKKRRYEKGYFPAETSLGKQKSKIVRKHGGNQKIRLLAANQANISDASGKTTKIEIVRVIKNPANVDYDRRGVITKGTIIATSLGNARVTSRPGQDGIVNAILVSKKGD
jgi:small subunit ribosomal protein S8e